MLLPCQDLLGERGKETQGTMSVSTQRIRVQREKSQAPPDLPCLPLYFSLNRLGVCLAEFLFSAACGLAGVGPGEEENRKILRGKVQDVTEN